MWVVGVVVLGVLDRVVIRGFLDNYFGKKLN